MAEDCKHDYHIVFTDRLMMSCNICKSSYEVPVCQRGMGRSIVNHMMMEQLYKRFKGKIITIEPREQDFMHKPSKTPNTFDVVNLHGKRIERGAK